MKRKGLVKKAVLPALVALVCSVIALTSVSYAWFTMGNQASVNEMELQVTTSDGLQISSSGSVGTYKSQITIEELKEINSNKFPEEVSPVSSAGVVASGIQQMYYGSVNADGTLTSSADSASGHYICFDLFIQTSKDYTLKLDVNSYVKSATNTETALAARVSFVDLGCGETAALAKAMTGTGWTASGSELATIWEPNHLDRAQAVKDNNIAADEEAVDCYGLISEFTGASVGTKSATSEKSQKQVVVVSNYTDAGTSTAINLLSLEEGYNRIRIYVWLEGQDVDCVNEISAGKLQVKLNFIVS